jgi:hypothetical protein
MLELFRQRIARVKEQYGIGDMLGPGDHDHWRLERLRQAIEGIYAAKRAGA